MVSLKTPHPAFLLMKKRKAEFQAELHHHNNLIMEEASSNIDNDKDKNLLWKVFRGNRRTNMPGTNSTPSLKKRENYFSKLSTSHDSNSVVLQLDERIFQLITGYLRICYVKQSKHKRRSRLMIMMAYLIITSNLLLLLFLLLY